MDVKNKHHFWTNLGIIIALNVLMSFWYFRIDLTEEKRHSLSNETINILEQIDDILLIKVYLEGDFPAGFTRLKNACNDLLIEYRGINSMIEFEFIDPLEVGDKSKQRKFFSELYEQGLQPTTLQVQENNGSSEKIIFPGAIVYFNNQSISVDLLQNQLGQNPEVVLNNSIEDLEYEFTNAIHKLMLERKPKIAFLEGNGQLSDLETADISNSLGSNKGSLSEYFIVERFNIKDYEVDSIKKEIDIFQQLEKLQRYQALIIAKPTKKFNELEKFLIDQYIMNGGKTMWLIDGVAMDMDSLKGNRPYSMALPLNLNLNDLLFKYGVRINGDLIMDYQANSIPIVVGLQGDVPQQKLFPWFYNPLFIPKTDHPITKNLDAIACSFVSSIDTIINSSVKKTPLLYSSKYTKLVKSPHRVSLGILENKMSFEQFTSGKQIVAIELEGVFNSVFENRLTPKDKDYEFKKYSDSTKMIVISDGDMIKNAVKSGGALPLGYNKFNGNQFEGNKTFIINSLNHLINQEKLLSLRSKNHQLRLLDKEQIINSKLKWQIINLILPLLMIFLTIFLASYLNKTKFR